MFSQTKQILLIAMLLCTFSAYPKFSQPMQPASQGTSQAETLTTYQVQAAFQERIRALEAELAINETALKNPTLADKQREGLRIRSNQLRIEIQRLRLQVDSGRNT